MTSRMPVMGGMPRSTRPSSCRWWREASPKLNTVGSCPRAPSSPTAASRSSTERPPIASRNAVVTWSARPLTTSSPCSRRRAEGMMPPARRRCTHSQPAASSWERTSPGGFSLRAVGDHSRPVLLLLVVADLVERRPQHWITGTGDAHLVWPAVFVLQMAGQVEVGQHCGARREAEAPPVVAIEPVSAPIVGQQKELAMQRLREVHSAYPSRAFSESTSRWSASATSAKSSPQPQELASRARR